MDVGDILGNLGGLGDVADKLGLDDAILNNFDIGGLLSQNGDILKGLASNMDKGASSDVVQGLVGKLFNSFSGKIPNLSPQLFSMVGGMITSNEQIAGVLNNINPQLSGFVSTAIKSFTK